MRELTIGKHIVKFFDSPRDLTIRRYSKYNKHFMIAMEVGSTITDYDKRNQRANGYLSSGDIESAQKELTNQRQCVFNALEEYMPDGMALACLVYSIDDKEYKGYSADILNEVLDKLDSIGFTKDMLDNMLAELKKKSKKKSKFITRLSSLWTSTTT